MPKTSGSFPVPQAPGQIKQHNQIFREFSGMNTQASRHSIKPEQFAWLENVQPIGHGNLKTVKAASAALATLTGESVYFMKGYNISNTPYMFCACSSGAAYQVNLRTFAKTTIATAGTFPSSGSQIAQWKNERILIINQTNYYSWDGVTRTTLGGTTSAPTAGQFIATYAGRVWISQGRTINYSAAASYTDFGGSGGNTIITDETLTSDISQLLSANNFLYFFGEDSINVIADVQVVGGVTQFSNTNISANSGSTFPQSIFPYFRAIWYANPSGIYGLYGATPRKASDDLDGIWSLVDFARPITGGTVFINNILCAAFMFTYDDPVEGDRTLIAIYFNRKWFVASQATGLTVMAKGGVNGDDILFASDGDDIFQLFEDDEGDISQTIVTALWDMGEFVHMKTALKLGIEVLLPPGLGSIEPTVDTETSSDEPSGTFSGQFEFTWTNSLGDPFTWFNSLAQEFTWLTSGYAWFQGDVETTGHYLGITIESETPQVQYIGMQLQYRHIVAGWGT